MCLSYKEITKKMNGKKYKNNFRKIIEFR